MSRVNKRQWLRQRWWLRWFGVWALWVGLVSPCGGGVETCLERA